MFHPLDNVVWSALTTKHARLAEGQGRGLAYPLSMAPFSGVGDWSAKALADLERVLDPGRDAVLFRPADDSVPCGWTVVSARPILQMVAPDLRRPPRAHPDLCVLDRRDAEDALELAALARPGPFAAETIALGRYLGIRSGRRLVAMAGQRFRLPGFAEISAVCTHPDYRGMGLGRLLVLHLMRYCLARGETPFLHVFESNAQALSLYRQLGFQVRSEPVVLTLRPPGG